MSEKTLKTRIRHAVKTESEWESSNPILMLGEIAYNSDNDKYKVGNGTSTWSQLSYKIPVTKSDIGLGNVENKSSATIRGELTKANVTNALGYTPPTTNTTYGVATSSTLGLVKSGTDITVDSSGNVSVNDNSHNHTISNVSGLQDKLNLKAENITLTNQDLNTVTTPGFYNAGGSNSVTNKPSGVDHFGLIVIHRASGSYYTQILFNDTSSYRRFCVNGSWGGWTQDKLTDTNTWRGIQNNLTSTSTTDSLSANQGRLLANGSARDDTKLPLAGGEMLGSIKFNSNSLPQKTLSYICGIDAFADGGEMGWQSKNEFLSNCSKAGHTHDNRYYTESEMDTKLNTKLNTSLKGTASGLAELDSTGRVPSSQLPSYVDDVIEGYLYNNKFYKESDHTTVITGETGKIYVDLTSNKTYRWSGSSFVVISETLALGETSATAYRGDRGKIAYDHSQVAHAPSNAEVNQNAFSNIVVGSTTIAADSKTDTLTLVAGSNVTLTPDATNDKITISSTNTDTKVTQTAVTASEYTNWRPLIWGASNSGTEGFTPTTVTDGTFTANTISCQPSSGTIRASVFKGNLSGNATTASKWTTARTLSLTGAVTGSATIDGSGNVSLSTSVNHTHNYAGSSSAGGSATSAVKLTTSAGSVTQPVYFSDGKPVVCTYTLGKSVPSDAVFTDKNVLQSVTTTENYRPLVFGVTNNADTSTLAASTTGQVYVTTTMYAQPSTGMIASTSHKIGEHVTLQYNSSTESLDFVFS